MEKSVVKIEHLSHRYSVDWAIRDINFEIKEKGIFGLLGSNGAGKSTTMNIMCGVLTQTEGEVFINGISLKKYPVEAKQYIGFLPQKPPLHPDLTIEEYLTHCAILRDVEKSQVPHMVDVALERCGIEHFRKRLIRNLSGGYQQRVGIAQGIVHDPGFVVLDEPTNGLDPNQIIEIRHLIREIAKDRAVMLSTHILSEVQAMCDHIFMIEHGQLVFNGSMGKFNSYAEPSTFVVTLENPPPKSIVEEFPGVVRVDHLTNTRFRIHFKDSADITKHFIAWSVNNHWRLSDLVLEKESLDTIFAQLSGNKIA